MHPNAQSEKSLTDVQSTADAQQEDWASADASAIEVLDTTEAVLESSADSLSSAAVAQHLVIATLAVARATHAAATATAWLAAETAVANARALDV
jgi:hypothetical protein